MKDEKGSLYIFDAVLAIFLLLMVIFIINSVAVSVYTPTYSQSVKDFTTAQDIMETLGGKVNFTDRTFLGDISIILSENENSEESIQRVCDISKIRFDKLELDNYRFSENNVLDGKVLAGRGDYGRAENISVAGRSYGDYYYTLEVW